MSIECNFINNEFVRPQSAKYIDNYCPATGKVYGQLPDSNAADVNAAVAAARAAFPAWSRTAVAERAAVLLRVAALVEERAEAFARAESLDQGKPVSLARRIDIPRVVANFRFFAGAVQHHEDMSTKLNDNVLSYSISEPVGVAGLISPWNLPLYLLSWKIAPAIACGNTCVCKPSEFTSVTAHMLAQVLLDARVPPGVVNIVFGTGVGAGAPLVQHADVPLISFTGGTATAKHIMRDSIEHFKKLSLELGGKNPNIIMDDADLDACIERTRLSSFANQGEICLCGSRILVQRGVYDEFVRRFVAECRKLVVGDPTAESTFMGALASEQHRDKVAYYVKLAQEEGGTVLLGGKAPVIAGFEDGYWFEPTIIVGLDHKCRTNQEEIFGPVVTITPFDTEDEAIEYANSVKYGLSASLWTESLNRAHRMARAIRAGTVWINCWLVRDLRVPFGGVKASGVGREGGKFSIDFYTEQKTVCLQTKY